MKDCHSIAELIEYLEKKGKNHEVYYHYTTWDSFKKIYEGSSFLLTRGNSLNINDQHEAIMKGSFHEWNKTYIASFSFGSAENMAMWGLYGLPWEDAIRIAIPKTAMLDWIDSIKDAEVWTPQRDLSENWLVDNIRVCLNDIVYVEGQKDDTYFKLTRASDHLTVKNENEFLRFDESPLMTGYIKNFAWHYENEVRLKINTSRNVYSEKIKVGIPHEVLKTFKITTGPCFEYKSDMLFQRLLNENRIEASGFDHLVKYRPLCALCKHEGFQKKQNI